LSRAPEAYLQIRRTKYTLILIVLSLAAIGFLLGGVVSFWDRKQFADRAVRVPGIVVDNIAQ